MDAITMMTPLCLDDHSKEHPWLVGGRAAQQSRRITGRHSHARGQILGVISGVMALRTDREYLLVGPDQVLWLPPRVVHTAHSHGAVSTWSLYVEEKCAQPLPSGPVIFKATSLLKELAVRIVRDTNERNWTTTLSRIADTFWEEFLSLPSLALSLPRPLSPGLIRVTATLEEDPADSRMQEEWASLAGMSVRTFVRHFASETGLNFSVWRQRLRMVHAQEQLARGLGVTSVALNVGYESMGAFASTFRRFTGHSPSEYARLCQAHKD